MMKSTRSNISVSASYAIVKGLASDGGLYVFEKLNKGFFNLNLLGKSYEELAFFVMRELLDDFSDDMIKEVVNKSYNKDNFKPEVVSLKSFAGFSYLNLFNGSTFAFKDLALSTLPNLFAESKKIQKINKKTIILTATSGDTGSAALSGFSKLDDVYVVVLYPAYGVSEFQEKQMSFYSGYKNIVLPVEGNFDDCQRIVKQAFNNLKPSNVNLSSANSINIGRIIPQVIYYIHAYCDLVNKDIIKYNDLIDITVPTGNFGNIYSAYLAKQLGVPIRNLVIASNKNNVLTDLFNEHTYNTSRPLYKTISPSMDILVSSNFERYLCSLYNQNSELVRNDMEILKKEKILNLEILKSQKDFYAYYCDELETKKTIKEVYDRDKYLIDPHTAVAYNCMEKYKQDVADDTYMLVVSTASPFKFSDAILDIFKIDQEKPIIDRFNSLSKTFNIPIDDRMLKVLDVETPGLTIELDKAYSALERIIGEIDAAN